MSAEFRRLNVEQAQETYRPGAPAIDSEPKSELESQLRQDGIASVELAIDKDAFQEISDAYASCIEEYPEWLDQTAGNFDSDGVPEDGHVRKDIKFNIAGMQIADPKSLFHFNNDLRDRIMASPLHGPKEFNEFLDNGLGLHSDLTKAARNLIEIVGESYKGINKLFFPGEISRSTFRLLRYDMTPIMIRACWSWSKMPRWQNLIMTGVA